MGSGLARDRAAAGATDRDVMQLMRHSSITVTANVYMSVFADLDRELASKMVRLVPRAGRRAETGRSRGRRRSAG